MGLKMSWSGDHDSGLRARVLPVVDRVEVWCTRTGEVLAFERNVWDDLITAVCTGRIVRPEPTVEPVD